MTRDRSVTLGIISVLASMLWVSGCNSNDNNDISSANIDKINVDKSVSAQVGPRPLFLVDQMQDSDLKTQLAQCESGPFYRTDFSIGHRGASMQFPEHTKEAYQAAINSGAGIVECDVTFTADKALVCRHSQCDLATTTIFWRFPRLLISAPCLSRQPMLPTVLALQPHVVPVILA